MYAAFKNDYCMNATIIMVMKEVGHSDVDDDTFVISLNQFGYQAGHSSCFCCNNMLDNAFPA